MSKRPEKEEQRLFLEQQMESDTYTIKGGWYHYGTKYHLFLEQNQIQSGK